jgi:hypothetical protein
MHKPLSGDHFRSDERIDIGRVPPVMPMTRPHLSRLSLAQNRGLAIKPDGKFAPQNRDALNHIRVAMLADHARPHQSRQFDDATAVGVLPRQLKVLHALTSDRVLPQLTDPDGREVTDGIGTWMPHARESRTADRRPTRAARRGRLPVTRPAPRAGENRCDPWPIMKRETETVYIR